MFGGRRPWPGKPPVLLLLDRQPLFVAALAVLLSGPPLRARVLSAGSLEVALARLAEEEVDVALCESEASPQGRDELLRQIHGRFPGLPVVLLSDRDEEDVLVALEGEAEGVFSKASDAPVVVQGLLDVLEGRVVIDTSLLKRLVLAIAEGSPRGLTALTRMLSPVETQVLGLLIEGASIHEISTRAGLPEATVRAHLATIYHLTSARMAIPDPT